MGFNYNERVELHCHTNCSRMNGVSDSGDIFRYANKEGMKAIKTFKTKTEAIEYANALAKSQKGTLLVHASKGKNKGKFIK